MAWKFKDLFARRPAPAAPAVPGADEWFERGNAQVAQQQWRAALDCYREAVRLDPRHAAAHAYMGNVLRQLGDSPAALAAYDRALEAKPDFAEAHYNRAAILQHSRRLEPALAGYEAALAHDPSFAEAASSRGDVLWELGRLDEALASYDRAIALDGRYARAHLQRARLQQQRRQFAAAESSYRQALTLRPDDALAHAGLGATLLARDDAAAAIRSFNEAVRLQPTFARAIGNRAQAQARLGLASAARASHDEAVRLDPRDASLQFNRGAFLVEQKDWPAAIQSLEAVIAQTPNHADAHCNLGLAQQESGLRQAALDSYSRALALNPDLATAYNNRGNLLRANLEFEGALDDYARALALQPASADAHYNLGQLHLLRGDFAAGWPEYEWRRQIEEARAVPARQMPQPAWHGDAPLEGRRILLHAEQGLGDTIQFCRYAKRVSALGATVIIEVPPSLAGLLARLEGAAQTLARGTPMPPVDLQCSLMSLPGVFKTTLATVPWDGPYLDADPDRAARWQEFLGPRLRARIGLAWSGNPRHSNDHNRSVGLARWLQHLPQGFDYVCLQNDIREADRGFLQTRGDIRTVESQLENFTDTAALISTLDLVISVDTSLAHLSGAMGRRTWILLPFLPDWRWMLERRDSPWYPTATLYRQPVAGDWDSVLRQVGRDLAGLAT